MCTTTQRPRHTVPCDGCSNTRLRFEHSQSDYKEESARTEPRTLYDGVVSKSKPRRAANPRTSAVIDLPRAMDVTHFFCLAMLTASAFGTNAGDLRTEVVSPGQGSPAWHRCSASVSAAVWCCIAVPPHTLRPVTGLRSLQCGRRRPTLPIPRRSVALSYVLATILLGVLTLVAARFT